MAESLTGKTTELSAGVTVSLPLHTDGTYHYPLSQLVPTELGGLSKYSLVAAASDNAAAIKASAGQLYGYSVYHIDASPVYLKFYNSTSAPTVGSDTPYLRFGIPANATAALGSAVSEFWPMGIAFSTGIAVACISGITDAGSGNLSASEVLINVYYK